MAHANCNLSLVVPQEISIYAHNSSKFDLMFILSSALKNPKIRNLDGVPYNSESLRTLRQVI